MAFDEQLAARVRDLLAQEPVEEKRMFGGLAFLLHGHMAATVSGEGGLLVRVDPARTQDVLSEPGAAPFSMGGRGPVTGWVRVGTDVLDDDAVLEQWVARGVSCARALPPKGG